MVERRPALNMRTTSDLRARLEASARSEGLSLTQEVVRRVELTFDRNNQVMAQDMASFWAWFEGLADGMAVDGRDIQLLGLVRSRLERATGAQNIPTSLTPPRLVSSA